jgi:hypothetical protein
MKQQLIDAIKSSLRVLGARVPKLAQRRPDKIYEIFILSCFVRAGRGAGLRVELQDDTGRHRTITVRGAPGSIYNSSGPNTYLLVGNRNHFLEIQHGIVVGGYSNILHEADISAIDHVTGQRCRRLGRNPNWRESQLITECKFYRPNSRNTNLPLGLGSNMLGLSAEFPDSTVMLCANQSKPAITQMLRAHQRGFIPRRRAFFELVPPKRKRVTEFCHWLGEELRHAL